MADDHRRPLRSLYQDDFYAWLLAQAESIRRGDSDGIDWANLIDEVESLGRSDRARARSQALNVIIHLLKIDLIAGDSVAHWRREIEAFRGSLERALTPSLRQSLPAELDDLYEQAATVFDASLSPRWEHLAGTAPSECPYSWSDVIGPEG